MSIQVQIKKPTSSGQLKELSFDIDNPKMKLDFMTMREMTILVGANGTGKTFMLVTSYFMGTLMQTKIHAESTGQFFDTEKHAQFLFDNVYHNPENISGTMGARFENGPTIDMTINQGKITSVNVHFDPNIKNAYPIVYMSSNLRLFSAMDMYLAMRKMTHKLKSEEIYEAMLKSYKLYDVSYVEGLIARMPIVVSQKLKDTLKNFDITENIEEFNVDITDCKFYVMVDGKRKDLCTYGNGHQALFNMFIAQPG